ncbi:bifunctional cytidylyltransferase/SDR family oxidoreductase [Streptomyces sp. NBS 14/10]|uniref:bifunctional cytidylyltransferase/SDR family oxidoreductase n=1 Tax=Streptomyces sp. NBS 14/10 TaxID=1945643 RepID=UPI000B7DE46D|nr:bifunctional cytidylyltransferase/SDR family oxidoreductase [Streptomyces sp. NBS 14/10]KAK1184379.1 bifunctional cytidylyltransferase/SDR family oxidoreductase [Streptomyces sp. NBS 14/10]
MPILVRGTRTVAVVLAGGAGTRIGLTVPKQLVRIAGKLIIEHTLEVFEKSEEIDDIFVIMNHDFLRDVQKIIERMRLAKVRKVIPGGSTRSESTQLAIDALGEEFAAELDVNVLFHDAVRPLLSQRVITDCVNALAKYEAVDVAIPSADTIIVTRTHGDEGEFISEIPDRSRLRRGQTPQAFKLSTIKRAYQIAEADPNFQATDDCTVVLRYLPDVPIHVVRGDEQNMKVTHPIDIFIADKLFQLGSHMAPASLDDDTYSSLLSGKVMVIFGASQGIGADIASLAEGYGAKVFAYSRSSTGTHIEIRQRVEEALADAYETANRIDFVVNTAGILPIGNLTETDSETIQQVTLVNYLGPVEIARLSHKYLAQTRGQLLLYTSSSYTRGRAQYSLYSSAKAATVNLMQALSDEWAKDHIRINCINPERTRTPMRLRAFGDEPDESLLTSEAVAQLSIDVLLSSLTGHVIDVRRQDPMNQKTKAFSP